MYISVREKDFLATIQLEEITKQVIFPPSSG